MTGAPLSLAIPRTTLLIGGNVDFLAVAVATHALVGYALGAVLFDAPRAGLLGGVLADVDLLVPAAWGAPLAHRGITHSAVAAGVAVAVALAAGRCAAGGVGAGYLSHLLIDATTPRGIPLAAPFAPASYGVTLGGHSPTATAAIWACCLAALLVLRVAERGPSAPVLTD